MKRATLPILATLLCLGTVPVTAQPPVGEAIREQWRTLDTEHVRIHFLPPAEGFARAVAARVEAVRGDVEKVVGHFPDKPIDIVIGRRAAVASAQGLPFREGPRVILHPTPPSSARLEDFDDWVVLSLGYELTQIALLSRPPENKVLAYFSRSWPVHSLIVHFPEWVPDAYASSVAYRLACAGGPRRPLAAALLREMATRGRLPALDDIEGDTTSGQAVATDFLTWLDSRPGVVADTTNGASPTTAGAGGQTQPQSRPGSLSEVWRQMTATRPRTFRTSIERTYGASLDELYAEWQRELTARWTASTPVAPAGSTTDALGAPDVAADGSSVVTLNRHDGKPRLGVVAPDGALRRWLDLDVAPSAEPRWLPDGSVLFVRGVREGDDELRGDLFRWWPEEERVERLTNGADLLAVDAADDGTWAAAVQSRWGRSALVRVELGDDHATVGAPLVAADDATLLDAPRLSPDDRRLAFLRHRGDGWRLVVRDLASGGERELGDPGLRVLAWPAWSPDGSWLVVTVAAGDEVRLEAWSTGVTGSRRLLSDPATLALSAGFDPGGADREPALVHLQLSVEHGTTLARLPWSGGEAPGTAALAPPMRTVGPTCPQPPPASGESRRYGRGPTTYSTLVGGGVSPSGNHAVSGWRGGDVVGRWEAVAIASVSSSGSETGGIVSGAWRGWRRPLQFHGYSVERRPSQQPEVVPGLGDSLDLTERGFALETGWRHAREHRTLNLDVAALAHKLEPFHGKTVDRYALQVRGDGDWTLDLPAATRLRLGVSLLGVSGWTDSEPWSRYGGELRGGLGRAFGRRIYALDASWSRLVVEDAHLIHDHLALGGMPSSLVPQRLDLARIYEAALPAGTAIGDHWESQRLAISHEGTRLRAFWARHRLWNEDGNDVGRATGRHDWIHLAGVEIALDRNARPLFRLPSSAVRAGVAYVFDEPLRHEWMYWAGLAWTL